MYQLAKLYQKYGGFNPDDERPKTPQCEKCKDHNQLLADLKEKLNLSNQAEKVRILTLAPESQSIKTTMTEFGVSEQATKLKSECGTLALPGKKHGKKLPQSVKKKVIEIFDDDELSRLCPGKKITSR